MTSDFIFVVGAPRSGTTLLRAMMNRHSRIGLCDETYFHYWVSSRARVFGDISDRARRARVVDRYLATTRVRRLQLDADALQACLLEEGATYPLLFGALLRFYAKANGKVRAGEKTPHHALIASSLLEWFPEARIIHLVRDPRDVVASLNRMPWGARSTYANAREWLACVNGAQACEGDSRCLAIRYEDLVRLPEDTLGRIGRFVGEAFEPGMLSETGGRADRWWFERAQGAVDTGRAGSWRRDFSKRDAAIVEWVSGGAMERYGYRREHADPAIAVRASARFGAMVAAGIRRCSQWEAVYSRWLHPDQLAREERVLDRS